MEIFDELVLFLEQILELYVQFWAWLIQISGQYGASQRYNTVISLDKPGTPQPSIAAFFV